MQKTAKDLLTTPHAHKPKGNGAFAGFAIRSLLVSGLMASGSMAALSSFSGPRGEPNRILRASLAPPLLTLSNAPEPTSVAATPELSEAEIARKAADAKMELAAASLITEAVSEATHKAGAGARPDYGFARLFSSLIIAKPDELSLSSDLLKFGPVRIRQDLVATILRAAKETGADPVLLMAIADKESSFVPGINASTSSAVGLFQFVEGTWFKVVRDFGSSHGLVREASLLQGNDELSARERLRILDMRKNPYLAALMAAEMLKHDAADIGGKLGRDLSNEEIYLAHFLGPGDAFKFLAKVDSQPKAVAAKLLPKPARANKPIFYARSKSLSVAEVHRKIEQAMGLRLDRYRNVTDSVPTATAYR